MTYDPQKIVMDYLQIIQKHSCVNHRTSNWPYTSIEDFLLQEGQEFNVENKVCTQLAEKRQCFKNAYQLIDVSGQYYGMNYYYCEGIALANNSIPMRHAWVYSEENNAVIDNTWNDGVFYFGVVIPLWYVRYVIFAREAYGVLDCWELGFPILTGEHSWPLDKIEVRNWFAKRSSKKK